ncbi:MAG: EscU/YscU/HrcU family type III secretion system export apparatus switch protein [Pseudomonadota bacterium]
MAENQSEESKTEEPTDRKIQQALEEGNVPYSRETATFGSMLAILAIVAVVGESAVADVTQALYKVFEASSSRPIEDTHDAESLLRVMMQEVGFALMPVLGLLTIFGLSAALMQNKPRMVAKRVKPQLSRISLEKGWKRIFGVNGAVEFGKILFKFISISLIAIIVMNSIMAEITNASLFHPFVLLITVQENASLLLASLCVAAAILAIADFSWSQVHWRMQLKMTRDEIKKELKQAEGDPLLKSRMLSLARGRTRQRMMAEVPLATLVLANPTHFSVALRYDAERDAAPVVVAKGQDLIALKIREVAEANNVPVIEDKVLARAIYKSAHIDQMIPTEFYRAVAEIILFLGSRQNGGPASNAGLAR